MAVTGSKTARDINKRTTQGDYKRYGLAKPKLKNPMNKVGTAIGNKLVPVKNKGKASKQQLMREYAGSKYATKKGSAAAKKRVGTLKNPK
jgi:hypothetical protein